MRALYQALTRHLYSESGEDPEDCKVLICASTGTATYNVDGYAVHEAFKSLCHHRNADTLNRNKIQNLVSYHDR